MHWNGKEESRAFSVSNFEGKAYAHIGFFVHLNWTNKIAYVCVCFIFKIGDATSMRIYFSISVHALKCGRTKFWVPGFTVKISSRMVQYVARFQYTNMEHGIQTYSAEEVRSVIQFYAVQNHGGTEVRKKLCAVHGPQCKYWWVSWLLFFKFLTFSKLSKFSKPVGTMFIVVLCNLYSLPNYT